MPLTGTYEAHPCTQSTSVLLDRVSVPPGPTPIPSTTGNPEQLIVSIVTLANWPPTPSWPSTRDSRPEDSVGQSYCAVTFLSDADAFVGSTGT